MKPRRTLSAAISAFALSAALATAPALGAERYSSWTDPDASKQAEASVQNLIDELNKLVTDAEKARAADPQFLRDLRDLARRYDNPWQVKLFGDDFADGDFTRSPTWTVASGRWWVEKGYGLRSEGRAEQAPASGQEPDRNYSGEDAAKQLLGALLNKALQPKNREQAAPAAPAAPVSAVGPASISLAQALPNAFKLRLELSSWRAEGAFEFGPYQGKDRGAGYRLVYRPGSAPRLELVRFSSRGAGVVDSVRLNAGLEDRKTHVIEWSRDPFGAMTVSVDDTAVLKASDRAFRDPFDGLAVTSRGGDVMLSRIEAFGVR